MIFGVGVDLCSVERVRRFSRLTSFMDRYFTGAERKYIESKGENYCQSAAGMIAAKEAFVKAIGTGFSNADLKAIEILHDRKGKPYYNLMGWAKEEAGKMGISYVFLSISHEAGTIAAFAVAECGWNNSLYPSSSSF